MKKDEWREVFLKTYSHKNEWHPDASPLDVAAFIEQIRKDAVREALEEVEGSIANAQVVYTGDSDITDPQKIAVEYGIVAARDSVLSIIRKYKESL